MSRHEFRQPQRRSSNTLKARLIALGLVLTAFGLVIATALLLSDENATVDVTDEVLQLQSRELFVASSKECTTRVRVRVTLEGREVAKGLWACFTTFTSGLKGSYRYIVEIEGERDDVLLASSTFTAPNIPASESWYRGLAKATPLPPEEELKSLRKKSAMYTVLAPDEATRGVVIVTVLWP